ncbi:MAG: DUF1592 domain-containing protein [Bryobacterales bacterium]|nr:DUF1592 domain-containing protein [Bryobacterales bacterium]
MSLRGQGAATASRPKVHIGTLAATVGGHSSRGPCLAALALSLPVVGLGLDRGEFLQQYCLPCHSGASPAGEMQLGEADIANPENQPQVWERVIRKLSFREMPPAGAPRPGNGEIEQFSTGLVADLDGAAQAAPYAGRPVIRRLNRTEYSNAIRDILALEGQFADRLPPDGQASGFDNVGDALSMSPLLLEGYLKTARRVSQLATGTSDPSPVVETYAAGGVQSAWRGQGFPYGTRGGVLVRHHFPRDGEYELRAYLEKQSLTPTEGVRFFRTRVQLSAGPHRVLVAFPDEYATREGPVSDVGGPGGSALGGPLDLLGTAVRPTIEFRIDGERVKLFEIAGMTSGESAFDGLPGPPVLGRIEIAGPYEPGGAADTPSRRRVSICRPSASEDEPACAAEILSAVARRAYRRNIASEDLRPLLETYRAARAEASFDGAIAAALRDILLAPDFLFRLEFDPEEAVPGVPYQVSDFELASRISFFLWSSVPDDALLDAASSNRLREPEVLERQIQRMLADWRAESLVTNFAKQWLGLRKLAEFSPDREAYPGFGSGLKAAAEEETRLFLRNLMREDRSILDILGADYTYLNETLARHYGITGVVGPGFRKVRVPVDSGRGGLLGQGSVLMLTSHAARTSPVLRGTWILDSLLNSPPPPPPANVPPLEESAEEGRKMTAKEQLARHRADPACAGCHSRIDALGFALENFDVVGRWRDEDGDEPVDASGTLASGQVVRGPQGLRRLLLEQPEGFARASVERLLTFALGRELDAKDQPTVRRILREAEAERYRFRDLVRGVIGSVPFQMREAGAG